MASRLPHRHGGVRSGEGGSRGDTAGGGTEDSGDSGGGVGNDGSVVVSIVLVVEVTVVMVAVIMAIAVVVGTAKRQEISVSERNDFGFWLSVMLRCHRRS